MANDRVLVVTATVGYRHQSIEAAETIVAEMVRDLDVVFARDETQLRERLKPDALRNTKLVMFVNTTGELDVPGRDELLRWVERGGSLIGIHSASDTWHEWPAWVEMLGGEFLEHPPEFVADIVVEDRNHPSTGASPPSILLFEEIYSFKNFHRDRVNVLLSLRGAQPLAWWRDYGKGRVLYTAIGHRADVWRSDWYQQHLRGAIDWALRKELPKKSRAVRHSQ